MAVYGLTTDGLVVKTLSVIREELSDRIKNTFGTSMKSSEDNAFIGQFVGIISEVAALVWELMETINSSQDPDKATGAALDALCVLTGTFRPPASYSAVTLTLTGDDATVVPAGSKVNTESTEVSFETNADATITLLDSWVALTAYALGDRVTNGGNAYQCVVAGTSAASGGPTTADETIVDATVTWTYLGEGEGAVDVAAQAVETGPVTAYARDLIVIDSTVAGWSGVINLLDASSGRDAATDDELRQLREFELTTAGSSPIDALRSELLQVPDVTAATIFVNNTDETNVDGMPPHSVEALVKTIDPVPDGFEQTIWDALLAGVAAGIQTHGLQVGTATDSQGTVHTMKFNFPTAVNIYAYIGVTYDADEYAENGDDLVEQAIVDWGDLQDTGKNAVPSSLIARAFGVDGVIRVDYVAISTSTIATPTTWAATTAYSSTDTVLNAGRIYRCTTGGTSGSTGPSATGTGITDGSVVWAHLGEEIPISLRELAVYDTSRITVVSQAGVP